MDIIKWKWGLIILLVLVMGCTGAVKRIVVMPDGETYSVSSKKDAMVLLKQGDIELIVDNKGKTTWVEGLLQYVLSKPNINLSNKEGN